MRTVTKWGLLLALIVCAWAAVVPSDAAILTWRTSTLRGYLFSADRGTVSDSVVTLSGDTISVITRRKYITSSNGTIWAYPAIYTAADTAGQGVACSYISDSRHLWYFPGPTKGGNYNFYEVGGADSALAELQGIYVDGFTVPDSSVTVNAIENYAITKVKTDTTQIVTYTTAVTAKAPGKTGAPGYVDLFTGAQVDSLFGSSTDTLYVGSRMVTGPTFVADSLGIRGRLYANSGLDLIQHYVNYESSGVMIDSAMAHPGRVTLRASRLGDSTGGNYYALYFPVRKPAAGEFFAADTDSSLTWSNTFTGSATLTALTVDNVGDNAVTNTNLLTVDGGTATLGQDLGGGAGITGTIRAYSDDGYRIDYTVPSTLGGNKTCDLFRDGGTDGYLDMSNGTGPTWVNVLTGALTFGDAAADTMKFVAAVRAAAAAKFQGTVQLGNAAADTVKAIGIVRAQNGLKVGGNAVSGTITRMDGSGNTSAWTTPALGANYTSAVPAAEKRGRVTYTDATSPYKMSIYAAGVDSTWQGFGGSSEPSLVDGVTSAGAAGRIKAWTVICKADSIVFIPNINAALTYAEVSYIVWKP